MEKTYRQCCVVSSQEALLETQGKLPEVKVRCERPQGNPNAKRMKKQSWSYIGGGGGEGVVV